MARRSSNKGKPWTAMEVMRLRALAKGNTPTRVAALKLGRTEDGVRSKASGKNIPLKPTNQSPYNRRGK